MIIQEMEYKHIHVFWCMNLDSDYRCHFKNYPLEKSTKHESQTGSLIIIQKITLGEDC